MKAWVLSASLLVAGCRPGAATDREAPELELLPCLVRGIGAPAECGTLEVAENPERPEGRRIGLYVVRLPARAAEPLPDPLFLLAGGPGQAATEAFGPMIPLLHAVNQRRDIVMVDQRGTGASRPLDCELPKGLEGNLVEGVMAQVARGCRQGLDAELTQYTTRHAAADLDRVRAALGYARINLAGGSYGTRLALEYARRHGESLRSMALDGVAPRAMKLPLSMARDAERALARQFAACSDDPACKEAFGDLDRSFRDLCDGLPRPIVVRDPRSGERVEVTMTRALFVQALRGLLYSPELTSLLPLTIEQAKGGDFSGFVAQASLLGESSEEAMSLGLFLSVVCAEDVAHITEAEIVAETEGTFLGRAVVDELRAACEGWPRAELEDDFAAPVVSRVPTLLLSGEMDPVTPPRWGDAAAEHLETARHLVVPGASHGTLLRGCTVSLFRDFLAAPDAVGALDASCLERAARDVPDFFIDFAGPAH